MDRKDQTMFFFSVAKKDFVLLTQGQAVQITINGVPRKLSISISPEGVMEEATWHDGETQVRKILDVSESQGGLISFICGDRDDADVDIIRPAPCDQE